MPPTAADDPIQQFLAADLTQRIRALTDTGRRSILLPWLGEDAVAAYDRLAPLVAVHLAGRAKNLVFVPGVMGSLLSSAGLGGVWWLDVRSRKHLNDLRLSSDGTTDAVPAHDIVPFEVDMTYEGFLAAVLEQRDLVHQSFAYDWRKPLLASTQRLMELVVRLHTDSAGEMIHLVAHSMGGLLVRATLMRHPELWNRLGRIVFLATPHYGSPAIGGYLKNHLWGFELLALLGRYLDRTTFRSLWDVLSLLPAPQGIYPGTRPGDPPRDWGRGDDTHPCANFDIYDAAAWRLDLSSEEEGNLQRVLDAAASFHRDLYTWHLSLDQEQRDRIAVIAGVGYKTLFRLAYQPAFGFLWQTMDRVTERRPGDPHREGDGRVPLASAMLENTGATRYVRAEHGGLPGVRAVYEDTFRWLQGQDMRLPSTSTAALAGHLGDDPGDTPGPLSPARPITDDPQDPGYLNLEDHDERILAQLEGELAAQRLPEFNRLHIL